MGFFLDEIISVMIIVALIFFLKGLVQEGEIAYDSANKAYLLAMLAFILKTNTVQEFLTALL